MLGFRVSNLRLIYRLSYIFSALPHSSSARPKIFYGLIDLVVGLDKKYLLVPYISKAEQILPWGSMTLGEKVEAYQHLFKLVKGGKGSEENPLLYSETIQFIKLI